MDGPRKAGGTNIFTASRMQDTIAGPHITGYERVFPGDQVSHVSIGSSSRLRKRLV